MNILKVIGKNQRVGPLLLSRFSLAKISKSHVVGDPFTDPIEISTAEVLLRVTEKHAQKVGLYCYDQNKELTYE